MDIITFRVLSANTHIGVFHIPAQRMAKIILDQKFF